MHGDRFTIHLHGVNARWFTPLLLMCFALFVVGAKAYLSRSSKDTIQAPSIEPAQRIYAQFPAAQRREAANSRVFRPRPRSLEPLPIMAMTRPIPEPIRPAPRGSTPVETPVTDAVRTVVAMATPSPAETPAPESTDGASKSSENNADTSAAHVADDAASDVAEVLAGKSSPIEGDLPDEIATSAPAEVAETKPAEAVVTAAAPRPDPAPSGGKPWTDALVAVAEQIDSAAVRMRSNFENGPAATLSRAFDALAAGQFERALRDFDTVLDRKVHLAQAWSGKGESLVGLNRFDEAAEAYAQAVAQPGVAITAHYNYGVVLYRLSQYADAGEQFKAVVKTDPDHAEAHYNLATLAQRDGRLSEALESWKAFTRLRPAVAGGWFNLGIVYMDYDRPGEAVACFKRVIELDNHDADAHINLAMAHLAADQPAEALSALEVAESRLPGDRVVLRYLADVHSQMAEIGGQDSKMHADKAAAYRSRIAAVPTREQRKAVAGAVVDGQP